MKAVISFVATITNKIANHFMYHTDIAAYIDSPIV